MRDVFGAEGLVRLTISCMASRSLRRWSGLLMPISRCISWSESADIMAPLFTLARHAATYHAGIPTHNWKTEKLHTKRVCVCVCVGLPVSLFIHPSICLLVSQYTCGWVCLCVHLWLIILSLHLSVCLYQRVYVSIYVSVSNHPSACLHNLSTCPICLSVYLFICLCVCTHIS